jgi:hypothetical protein
MVPIWQHFFEFVFYDTDWGNSAVNFQAADDGTQNQVIGYIKTTRARLQMKARPCRL